jgi:hypothetical protein
MSHLWDPQVYIGFEGLWWVCTLVYNISQNLWPHEDGTQQHYTSPQGAYCGINITLQQYFYKTTKKVLPVLSKKRPIL